MIKTNYQNLNDNNFALIPDGKYDARVDRLFSYDPAIKKATIILKIVSEQSKGRTIFLNLEEEGNEFAQKQLNQVCKVCGVEEGTKIKDLQELYELIEGAVVKITVGSYTSKNTLKEYNTIKYIDKSDEIDLPL